MKQKIQLQIPEPCHEHWNNMNATQQGRFCMSCQKEVIDFSVMSDKEIIDHISKGSEKMCGRFCGDQLNRNLIMPAEPRKIWWKYWMSVAASFVMLVSKSNAQLKVPKDTIVASPVVADTNVVVVVGGVFAAGDENYNKRNYTITGVVKDEKNEPVPGTTIMIKGTKTGTASTENGRFSINVTDRKHVVLQVSSVGFEMQDVKIENHSNQTSMDIDVKLKPVYTGLMGDVVITKVKKKRLLNYFKTDSVKKEIEQPKQTLQTLTIYPNPVIRGADIKMSFDNLKEGSYMLSVFDIMGNAVINKEIKINGGSVKESLQCDQRFNTGVYVFSITGNGKSVSSKCIVQ